MDLIPPHTNMGKNSSAEKTRSFWWAFWWQKKTRGVIMKKLTISMIEASGKQCENCGSNEKVYRVKERNNFHILKNTDGYLCKKCWLLSSKIAYEEEFGNKE